MHKSSCTHGKKHFLQNDINSLERARGNVTHNSSEGLFVTPTSSLTTFIYLLLIIFKRLCGGLSQQRSSLGLIAANKSQ